MARTAKEYRDLLFSLLPPGKLFPRDINTTTAEVLLGSSDELNRVETRMEDLLAEARVDTVEELLPEFEEEYGIPDPGQEISETTAERREVLKAKLVQVGQQDKGYFEEIASELDYDITIVEHKPFWVGLGTIGEPCGDQWLLFTWYVYINIPTDPNDLKWNISQLMTDIKRLAPAQTRVYFEFYGAEFSRAFSRAFDSIRHYDGSWFPGSFSRDFDSSFANAYDYDGITFTGAFDHSFSLSFDRHSGGAFYAREFSADFNRPV